MTQTPFPVMLFAAGFGTRMGALTQDRPKPMIEVAGKPLIDHTLALVQAVNPPRVVANLHYKPDTLATHLRPKGVLLSIEEPEILETGGGLRHAAPLLQSQTVITMNTDAIWAGPNPLPQLVDAWDPERMDALLMCIPVSQALGHDGTGDFTADDHGRIERGPGLIYGGLQILKTDSLAEIDETSFSLNVVWDRIRSSGRLFAVTYTGRWCDVGHPAGITLAESLLIDV